MLGLDDASDAARSQMFLDPIGDLRGKPLLDLKIMGEGIDSP